MMARKKKIHLKNFCFKLWSFFFFFFSHNKMIINSTWMIHLVHHSCMWQPVLALLLTFQPIIWDFWMKRVISVGGNNLRDCVHAPFQGSLCGLLCCCIFYSIRIFGKLWPLQQVNDVGNFSFLIIIFPSSVWICDKLLALARLLMNV